jgi:hypothetical protein
MTSWALLLALAVSVLVPSSTHAALSPASLRLQHATASRGLFACPFASPSLLQRHGKTTPSSRPGRDRASVQAVLSPSPVTASANRDRQARRRHVVTKPVIFIGLFQFGSFSPGRNSIRITTATSEGDSGVMGVCYALPSCGNLPNQGCPASAPYRSQI